MTMPAIALNRPIWRRFFVRAKPPRKRPPASVNGVQHLTDRQLRDIGLDPSDRDIARALDAPLIR